MTVVLQWISIVAALLAAFFWYWSASVVIPPITMAIWDGKKLHRPPHELALQRAARLSAIAAIFAATSALSQGISFYLTLPNSN